MSDQSIHTLFKGTKSDFIKAMVYGRDLEAFKALGFVDNGDLLPEVLEPLSELQPDVKAENKHKGNKNKPAE